MKAKGKIVSVDTTGESLIVKAECKFLHEAKWHGYHEVTFHAPVHEAKSYYIGRQLEICVVTK
jgi:hypothetical protein